MKRLTEKISVAIAVFFAASFGITNVWVHGQSIALVGATVHPVSSPPISDATILIVDSRIAAVGKGIVIPDGARRIDARGKIITPGLIHVRSQVGLIEIGRETIDSRASDNDVSAGLDLTAAINPSSQLIPVTRAAGVTTVVSFPTGGIVSGQAIALQLAGRTALDMILRAPAAIVGNVSASARTYGGGSRAGVHGTVRTLLDDAILYHQRKEAFTAGDLRELSASSRDLEALGSVLNREIPLVLTANRRSDIEAAVRLAADYRVRLVVSGGKEASTVAGLLAEADIPVMMDPLENSPTYDGLETSLDNAAILAAAGVTVMLYVSEEYNPRLLPQHAGNAVAHGMNWNDALRAVTMHPATVFGLDSERGTLEVGKLADLVVWAGDPFELSTRAERVFVSGSEVSQQSRQTLLMEKYRALLSG